MADLLLHDLLAGAAETAGDRTAVRCSGVELSYGELHAAAGGIANTLAGAAIGRGDRVGILLPKGVEMLAAVYGVLQAGAAYVPLDPRAPLARTAAVAADGDLAGLISSGARTQALLSASELVRPKLAVLVDEDGEGEEAGALGFESVPFADAVKQTGPQPAAGAVAKDDLAYILYTSGSTGNPKGVMLTHANARAFVDWCASRIGVSADDRVSNHAPLHFDLSVLDLFLPASAGATLVLVPEEQAGLGAELARFVREESISFWYSVPSALMMMTRAAASEPEALSSLSTVIFAGEVYPAKHLRKLRALVPKASMWNLYGPTETNVCTYLAVEDVPVDDRTLPIGHACENGTETFAISPEGAIVGGAGDEGELFVTGPTVMQGYWGMPDKTAEVLVPDPRGGPAPAYRTGDLVRVRTDGDFDFLGRRDHQVKSRGYRIELGDVEAALNAHPDLVEAVAVAVPHEEWGCAIVACVVARDGAGVRPVDVRRHVAERLPRYMVPVRVDVLEAVPRTPNGKIDRNSVLERAAAIPI